MAASVLYWDIVFVEDKARVSGVPIMGELVSATIMYI